MCFIISVVCSWAHNDDTLFLKGGDNKALLVVLVAVSEPISNLLVTLYLEFNVGYLVF